MTSLLAEATGIVGMTGGQSLDLEASGNNTVLEHLELIHKLKTGALIKASVKIGALCNSEIDQPSIESLERYADSIGLAFQIQDDILDEVGDTVTLGKPQWSDKAQAKTTYVGLLGLQNAKSKARGLTENAIQALDGFPSSADNLRALATYIVDRIN